MLNKITNYIPGRIASGRLSVLKSFVRSRKKHYNINQNSTKHKIRNLMMET